MGFVVFTAPDSTLPSRCWVPGALERNRSTNCGPLSQRYLGEAWHRGENPIASRRPGTISEGCEWFLWSSQRQIPP